MKSAISSIENRSSGEYILLDVDERNFNPEGVRLITKTIALDGTALTTDWGYPAGNMVMTLSNFLLSKSDYDTLIGMKEDSSNTFLFHYRNSTWRVAVQNASGNSEGDKVLVNTLALSVIEKYPDGETS